MRTTRIQLLTSLIAYLVVRELQRLNEHPDYSYDSYALARHRTLKLEVTETDGPTNPTFVSDYFSAAEVDEALEQLSKSGAIEAYEVTGILPRYSASERSIKNYVQAQIQDKTQNFSKILEKFGTNEVREILLELDENSSDSNRIVHENLYIYKAEKPREFSSISESLNKIKNEFDRDHNKKELLAAEGGTEFYAEVLAASSQVSEGLLNKKLLEVGLARSAREYISTEQFIVVAAAYPGLKELIENLIDIIRIVISA